MNNPNPTPEELAAFTEGAWSLLLFKPEQASLIARENATLAAQLVLPSHEAHALLVQGSYELRYGEQARGQAMLESLREQFAHLGDRVGLLRTEVMLAQGEVERGHPEMAEARLAPLATDADQVLGALDHAFLLNTLSIVANSIGQPDTGLRLAYQALSLLRAHQDAPITALLNHNVGVFQLNAGNYDLAQKLLSDALLVIRQVGNPSQIALFSSNLALCLIHQGQPTIAQDIAAQRVAKGQHGVTRRDWGFLLAVQADACSRAGAWEQADKALNEARQVLANDDDPFFRAYLSYLDARRAHQTGDQAHALLHAEAALAEAERSHDDQLILDIVGLQAASHAAAGDHAAAYATQRIYHERYRRLTIQTNDTRYLTLQVQHELAEAESARDRARNEHAEAEHARLELAELNHQLADRLAEIESLQVALREQAIRDPLTGLYNRRYLQESLPSALQLAIRAKWTICVALIDIDHFKQINDSWGHGLGDATLVALSQVLRDGVRGSDYCCRYGGEEFCLVFNSMDAVAAAERIKQLLIQFSSLVVHDGSGQVSGLTFSAGVACSMGQGHDSERLLRSADQALYRAKDQGRNQVLLA